MPKNSKAGTALPKVLNGFNAINKNKTIKLRHKYGETKGYSLYLDLWFNGKRHYEFLNLYVIGKATTLKKDQETLKIAQAMRDDKEIELLKRRTGFELTNKNDKASFLLFFTDLANKKKHRNWFSCLKHLKDFAGDNITFGQVDKAFVRNFKDYLLTTLNHENTAQTYFARFKTSLKTAVELELLHENPAATVTIERVESAREFLTESELKKAIKTPASDIEVKNAFIFSCYTGLRISDVIRLRFEQIQDGKLSIKQYKTGNTLRNKLHPKALEILKDQKEYRKKSEDGTVFVLPIDYGTINKVVRNWLKKTGIKKKITFHCARHTFATFCLTHDIDIYTVSKLLGHKDLKTTQIYAKLIDKKKDEAIDKLPHF